MVIGELAPELVALGEVDGEVEGLLGERVVDADQVLPRPPEGPERRAGIVELALVDARDGTEGVEAAERAVGVIEAVLAEIQERVPQLVGLGDGLDPPGDLVVVGVLAQRSLEVDDRALGIVELVLGDLGRVDHPLDELELILEGLALELALGDLEHRHPQPVGLGQLAQATEALVEVELLLAGEEVAAPAPGERPLGVLEPLFGDPRGLGADVELAGDVAHLGQPVDPQLVDLEQLLPAPVGRGELLDVGAELGIGRVDAARATEQLERAATIARALIGDLRHPPEGRDLLVGVVGDQLELVRERAQGLLKVAELLLEVGELGVAGGVAGELAQAAGRRLHRRALVAEALPGRDDQPVQVGALARVLGPEQHQLGVADQLLALVGGRVGLEQGAVDLGVAGADALGHLGQDQGGLGRVVDLVEEQLGLLPAEAERLLLAVGELALAAEDLGEAFEVVVDPVDADERVEGSAVVRADLDHALVGRAGQLGVAEHRLGGVAEPEQVIELADDRGLARARGLAEQGAELLVAAGRLVERDDLVDDLEVVGLEVEQPRPVAGRAIAVVEAVLGDPGEAAEDLGLAAGLAGDLVLALERGDQQLEVVGLLGEQLQPVEGLEVVAGQGEDLLAGPHRLGVGVELVVPQLGHAPEQRDPLGRRLRALELLLEQLDDLVVIAGAIVEGGQGPDRGRIAGREVEHLAIQLDRSLRVDLAVAVDLREPLDDLEPLAGVGGPGQLGLLDPDHVVPHARALLDASDLLARARVLGVGRGHPRPRVDGPVDVAEAALADLGQLDELLGELGGVERARVAAGPRAGGLLDLVEDQITERRPRVLAPEVLLVALERLGVEGLALEHLEVEQRRALVIVELVVEDLGGLEQARGRDRGAELLDLPLEQGRERGPVAAGPVDPLERGPGLAVGGLILAGLLVADPRLLASSQALVEVAGAGEQDRDPLGPVHVAQDVAVVLVELHPVGLLGEQLGEHRPGLVVIRAQAQGPAQQLEGLLAVAVGPGQLRGFEEDARGLGHALVAGLARAEVEGPERAQGREAVRGGLDRRLEVAGSAGEVLVEVRGDPREAEVEVADPGRDGRIGGVAGVGLELGQLRLHQLDRPVPGARAQVEVDQVVAGDREHRVLGEGLLVVLDGLTDRVEAGPLQLGVGEVEAGEQRGLGLAGPGHPPAEQGAQLRGPVELGVEGVEALVDAIVLGLGEQRPGEGVGGGVTILDPLGEQLVGLNGVFGDLGLLVGFVGNRGRVLDEQLGHRAPVAGVTQGTTSPGEGALVSRRVLVGPQGLGVVVRPFRQWAGQGGVEGSHGRTCAGP